MQTALSLALLTLSFASGLSAQQKSVAPDWDIRAVLKEIAAHAGRLQPVLDQVNPSAWAAKGAPETYVAQWNSTKAQARALAADALALAKNPEKLSASLEIFFRMQSLEYMLGSLDAGVRRYQTSALADQLSQLVAENGANRERFQSYIVELAAEREQEYQVMDHEAQRCRAFLVQQPAAPRARRKARK